MTPPVHLYLSEVLGNRIVSGHVRRAVSSFAEVAVPETVFTSADWAGERTALSGAFGPTTEALRAARRVLERARVAHGATVVATSWELGVAAAEDRRVGRVVVLGDAVPTPGFRRAMPTAGPVSPARRLVRRVTELRFRHSLRRTSGVLALSDLVRREVVRLAPWLAATAFVTRPPVPDWAAQLTPRVDHGPRPLRLLFVGNDFARKGGDRLPAMLRLLGAATPTELRVVTNDPAAPALVGGAGEVIRGIRHPSELADQYAWADILVLPTRNDMSPNVLLEAGAAGVPSIATDIGAIAEVAAPGERGWLMPPEADDAAWAAQLRELAAEPAVVAAAAARARAWVMEQCSPSRFEAAVHACLRAAASTRGTR
jgi:glycosyltransferase involved in cell wall biosynthesis